MYYVDSMRTNIKTFTLTKIIEYQTVDHAKVVFDNLTRLRSENFNRILIPNYEYSIEDKTITIVIDYIKGFYFADTNIVIEDVVNHKSDYTFYDFHRQNYIVCENTKKSYMIDLDSYVYCPSIEERMITFNKQWKKITWLEKY